MVGYIISFLITLSLLIYFTNRSLDLDDKGYVGEEDFRNMMKGKPGITPEDVEEMITEYKGFEKKTESAQDKEEAEAVIYYKGKISEILKQCLFSFLDRFCCDAPILRRIFLKSMFKNLHPINTTFLTVMNN